MEKADLIRELQEQRRDLDAEVRDLDAKLQKQLAALEGLDAYLRYLRESDKGRDQEPSFPGLRVSPTDDWKPSVSSPETADASTANGHPKKMVLAQEVRRIIRETEGEFTQQDITQKISEKYPDEDVLGSSVYNAITRTVRRGEARKVRDGSGSEPTVFERVLPDDPLRESPVHEESAVSG